MLAKLLELWHPNSKKYLGAEKIILVLLSTFKVQVLYPGDSFKQLGLFKCFALCFLYESIFNLFGIFKEGDLGISSAFWFKKSFNSKVQSSEKQ